MQLQIYGKPVVLSEQVFRMLSRTEMKISRFLPGIRPEMQKLHISIRRNADTYYPKWRYPHISSDYSVHKSGLAHFEGSMLMRLPKKPLYLNFKSRSVEEGINSGLKKLLKELKEYKELHFSSESKYPDHQTFRRKNLSRADVTD